MFVCKHNKWVSLFSLLIVVSLLLSACGAPTPEVIEKVVTEIVRETVKETVIVEGTPQVVEKVVTSVVEVEKVVTSVVEVEKVVTPTPEPTEVKSTEPVYGGVFTTGFTGQPAASIDPHADLSSSTGIFASHTTETLVAFGEDYSIVPMLAESWEVSDDGKSFTFHLRKGVKFHNGKEMTSEDVLASIERFLVVTSRKTQFEILDSYEAPDEYTFVMHLKRSSASFLGALASPSSSTAIFPKEVMDAWPTKEVNGQGMDIEDIIGTGPYQWVEYKPDQYAIMTRFEDYQQLSGERDGLGGAKIAYFDELHWIFQQETGARMAGIEVGEFDLIGGPPSTELDRIKADPSLKLAINRPNYGSYLLLNHANWPTDDVRFRQAVLAALDMEEIGMAVYGGRQELFGLTECIWPPETVWYFEDPLAKELHNQNDPGKCKQLLEEVGYNGEEIVIATARAYDSHYKQGMSVADQLINKCGMNVKVELYDWPSVHKKWAEESGWHISFTNNITLQLLDPNVAAAFWDCGSANAVRVHYCNPDMDAAFDVLDAAVTFEERHAALKEVHRIFWETLPNIKTIELYGVSVVRADILGYTPWYRERYYGVWRQQ